MSRHHALTLLHIIMRLCRTSRCVHTYRETKLCDYVATLEMITNRLNYHNMWLFMLCSGRHLEMDILARGNRCTVAGLNYQGIVF